MSDGCGSSSGTRSSQSGPGVKLIGPASVRPGAPPATLTRTTGQPFFRNARARRPAFSRTGADGCAIGNDRIPFCRSMITSAVLTSNVVSGMASPLGRGLGFLHDVERRIEEGAGAEEGADHYHR